MRRRRRTATSIAAFALVVAATAAPARAADADETSTRVDPTRAAEPPAPPAPLHWYGWEILLADVPAYVTFAAGRPYSLGYENPPDYAVIDAAVPMYLASGPIVHAVNGRWRISFASVGVRLTSAWTGWWVSLMPGHACQEVEWAPDTDQPYSRCPGMYEGMIVGAGLGTLIDAFALGWKRGARPETARDARATGFAMSPVLSPRFAGFAGTF